jgi:ATP-dependent Clp protease protease subunit
MAKELYLYTQIYDFVAEYLISQMEENKGEDIILRANTPGGSVFPGWGIIAKMTEHEHDVLMKVDGYVASMGTFCLVFAKRSQALDVSKIHLHRADGYVNSPEDQEFLDNVNRDLKAKLLKKLDVEKFKQITGFTVEDLFAPDKKVEVWLDAKQAKAVGLIDKIVRLEPSEVVAMNERFAIAASLNESEVQERITRYKITSQERKPEKENPQPKKVMKTLDELKANHPELYAQAIATGQKSGAEAEQKRVAAWEAWRHIDASAVDKGIKEGREITMADISEFSAKALSPEALKKLSATAAPGVTTGESTQTAATETEQEVQNLEASVLKSLGKKPKAA